MVHVVNPIASTMKDIQKQANAKLHSKIRKYGNRKKAIDYAKTEHPYEMLHGEIRTGIFKTMLGSEAKLFNQRAVLDFGSGKTKNLYKWCWLKKQDTWA